MQTLFKNKVYIFLFIVSLFLQTTVLKAETSPVSLENKSEAQIQDDQQKQSQPKQYYIVEVILFKHLNEQGKNEEFWNIIETNNNLSSASQNIRDTGTQYPMTQRSEADTPALAHYDLLNKQFLPLRNGVAALSRENYKLSDSAAHLRYSPDFRLLAHFGWTQRSLSKNRALPILITAEHFSDDMLPQGEMKLYVSRYLHMQVDLSATQCKFPTEAFKEQSKDDELDKQLESGASKLDIQQAMASNNTPENELEKRLEKSTQCVEKIYQFKQKRKMRSRELHYMDNPVFGMLVYITPFTISATETETAVDHIE